MATARQAGNVAALGPAEGALRMGLSSLFTVAEAYPDLKANQNFLKLQNELADLENKIAAARRFFNNAVSEYNTAIEQFPAVVLAGMFGFKEKEFFEIGGTERATPSVSF